MPQPRMSPAPSSTTPSEFVQIIGRIRSGDERALERLLAAVTAALHRMADKYISSSLRPYVDAEDLVQRAALILWTGLRSGKFEVTTPQQLTSLARTLLRRQAARAVQRFKLDMAATVECDLGATLGDQRLMPAPGHTQKAEVNEQIHQLMKRVDDDDRRMLQLLLLGHSIAGAARILKVEPATLRMRLSRLRVRVHSVQHVHVQVRKVQVPEKASRTETGFLAT
jgi:RNA polymerase sigma factor (sigma-70 family)